MLRQKRNAKNDESIRKLLHFAVGLALALVFSHYFLSVKWCFILAGVLAVVALLALLLKGTVRLRAVLLCAGAALGFVWHASHYQIYIMPFENLVGETVTASARITDYPLVADSYSRLTVRLDIEGYPGTRAYIYDYGSESAFSALSPGDEISVGVRFTSALRSSGEEIDTYISSGIFARGYLSGEYEITGRWGWSFLYFPKQIARAIKDSALSVFPGDVAPFMMALLTGDKSELYNQTKVYTNLQIASIVHVVAVSGMHMAFLLACVRTFTGRRRMTAFICLPLILFFMAMVGFRPSVVRAGLMYASVLAAPFLNRESDAATSLALPLVILLIINPQSIGSISLQLSFAAMAGLIVFSPGVRSSVLKLRGRVKGDDSFTKRTAFNAVGAVAGVLGCSVGAMIFTIPLSAYHFGFASLYGIFSNILCMWAISIAFNLGYLVCIVGLILPQAGAFFGMILAFFPRYVIAVSGYIAALPYAALYTSNNIIVLWLIFVYALFAATYFTSRGEGFRPVIPICAAIITLGAVSLYNTAVNVQTLKVTALDVGQGQSVVAMQSGSTVVIDCGNINSSADAGEITAGYLLSYGRSTIDLLILTHMHEDHVDGVESLLYRTTVKRIILPEEQTDSEYFGAIEAAAEEQGTEIILLSSNTYVIIDDLSLKLFAPMGSTGTNERGIIILGEYGDFSFLVTGDVNSATERLLVTLYDLPEVELYVAGHHGSAYSSGEHLLDTINPEAVFISVGYNTYGHPAQGTLEALEGAGADVYRTDQEGNLSISLN